MSKLKFTMKRLSTVSVLSKTSTDSKRTSGTSSTCDFEAGHGSHFVPALLQTPQGVMLSGGQVLGRKEGELKTVTSAHAKRGRTWFVTLELGVVRMWKKESDFDNAMADTAASRAESSNATPPLSKGCVKQFNMPDIASIQYEKSGSKNFGISFLTGTEGTMWLRATSGGEAKAWIEHLLQEIKNQAQLNTTTASTQTEKAKEDGDGGDLTMSQVKALLQQAERLNTLACGDVSEAVADSQEALGSFCSWAGSEADAKELFGKAKDMRTELRKGSSAMRTNVGLPQLQALLNLESKAAQSDQVLAKANTLRRQLEIQETQSAAEVQRLQNESVVARTALKATKRELEEAKARGGASGNGNGGNGGEEGEERKESDAGTGAPRGSLGRLSMNMRSLVRSKTGRIKGSLGKGAATIKMKKKTKKKKKTTKKRADSSESESMRRAVTMQSLSGVQHLVDSDDDDDAYDEDSNVDDGDHDDYNDYNDYNDDAADDDDDDDDDDDERADEEEEKAARQRKPTSKAERKAERKAEVKPERDARNHLAARKAKRQEKPLRKAGRKAERDAREKALRGATESASEDEIDTAVEELAKARRERRKQRNVKKEDTARQQAEEQEQKEEQEQEQEQEQKEEQEQEQEQERGACYFLYKRDSDTLLLKWSMEPVPNAIGCFLPGEGIKVPRHKFVTNHGRQDIKRGRSLGGSTNFYEGVVEFIKEAHRYNACKVVLASGDGAGVGAGVGAGEGAGEGEGAGAGCSTPYGVPHVHLWLPGEDLQGIPAGATFSMHDVEGVAVFGKDVKVFHGVDRLPPKRFVELGIKHGAAGNLAGAASKTKPRKKEKKTKAKKEKEDGSKTNSNTIQRANQLEGN